MFATDSRGQVSARADETADRLKADVRASAADVAAASAQARDAGAAAVGEAEPVSPEGGKGPGLVDALVDGRRVGEG